MYQPAEILTKWAEETGTEVPYHVYLEEVHTKRSFSCKATAHYFGITTIRVWKALTACGIPTRRATQLEVYLGTRDHGEIKKGTVALCLEHGSINAASRATGVHYFCFQKWSETLGCVFYVFPFLRAIDDSHSLGFAEACKLVGVSGMTPYNNSGVGKEHPTATHWLASKLGGKYKVIIPCGMSKREFKKIAPEGYLVDVTDRRKYRGK